MPTQDDEIARYLREAAASGELSRIDGYGKPFAEDPEWAATPEEFRMTFKILKNAGFVPPELEMFNQRAALTATIEACTDDTQKVELRKRLSELQQKIAIRLEVMRANTDR